MNISDLGLFVICYVLCLNILLCVMYDVYDVKNKCFSNDIWSCVSTTLCVMLLNYPPPPPPR